MDVCECRWKIVMPKGTRWSVSIHLSFPLILFLLQRADWKRALLFMKKQTISICVETMAREELPGRNSSDEQKLCASGYEQGSIWYRVFMSSSVAMSVCLHLPNPLPDTATMALKRRLYSLSHSLHCLCIKISLRSSRPPASSALTLHNFKKADITVSPPLPVYAK